MKNNTFVGTLRKANVNYYFEVSETKAYIEKTFVTGGKRENEHHGNFTIEQARRCYKALLTQGFKPYNEESKGSSSKLYEVRFEFLNNEGKWIVDSISNNGKGFTFEDAQDVARQLAHDSVCTKRGLAIVPLHIYHCIEKWRDNGDIDRYHFRSTQNAGEIEIQYELMVSNYDCNAPAEYIKKAPKLASMKGAKWHYARLLSLGYKPGCMDENWLEASK